MYDDIYKREWDLVGQFLWSQIKRINLFGLLL